MALLVCVPIATAGCDGSSAARAPSATRQYVDATGRTVTIPTAPKRVVALSEPTLDAALALGVKPVATTLGRGQGTIANYLQHRAGGIRTVGILAQPSIEKVAALHPDLILTDGSATLDAATRDKLARFAPTVVVSRNAARWQTAFKAAADVLGRSRRGTELLAAYDRRIADVKARLGANAGAQISIVRWGGIGLPAVLKQELPAASVLTDLGLTRPPSQRGRGPGHSVPVSYEQLEQIDGDWIFFGSLGAGGAEGGVSETPADLASARKALKWAEETPGFTRLKAYRLDHVVPVDGSVWTSAGGYLAEQVVLDDVERTLATG